MKIDRDEKRIREMADQYGIGQYFSEDALPFSVIYYEKGEVIITPMEETRYLQFILEGRVSVYSIRGDGSYYQISEEGDCYMLGDIEFVTGERPEFWGEAQTDVMVLALPVRPLRQKLLQDSKFVEFLMKALVKKMKLISRRETRNLPLDERILEYMKYICPGGVMTHVGHGAEYLHCSRRQMQRTLKKMTEEGRILHTGRGIYECLP